MMAPQSPAYALSLMAFARFPWRTEIARSEHGIRSARTHGTPPAAAARNGDASGRALSWLWRRWQRPDRSCAALAKAIADRCFRGAECARALRRFADRFSVVRDLSPRSRRDAKGRRIRRGGA